MYEEGTLVRRGGGWPDLEQINRWRQEARDDLFRDWARRLEELVASAALVGAVRPVLRAWVEREHGAPTYHLTQLLTGHGCFAKYLWEVVGIEAGPECHDCNSGVVDSGVHTLAVCTAWEGPRRALVSVVGRDLTLPALVRQMADSVESWAAVASFAAEVMVAKREALRVRERAGLTLPPRRAVRGRRRAAYARTPD